MADLRILSLLSSGLSAVRSVCKLVKVRNASSFAAFFNIRLDKSFAGVHSTFSLCVEKE